MKRFFKAVAAGMKAFGSGHRFEVAGKAVRCVHCSGERFVEGTAQLNTAGLTFVGLDWANQSATTLACVACGRIEWFLANPEIR